MKSKSVFTAIGVPTLLAFGSIASLMGAPLYWDTGNGTGLQSGNGTWSASGTSWATSLTPGGNSSVAWTADSDAIFNSTSGTSLVTVSGVVSVNSITFNGAGYTIQSGTITLTGAGGSITANADATISSQIAGTVGLTKKGTGNLILSGSNTYTGLTDIQTGTLTLGANSVFADASTLKISGGILSLLTFSDTVAGVQLTSGSITGSGTLTSTTTFDLQSGSVSAKLGGSVGLNKTTGGTVTLSGANTYTGNTTVSAGTLALSGSGSIAAAGSTISVASGATLDVSAVTGGSWTVQGVNTTTRQILTGSGGVTGATVIGSSGTHNAGSGGVGTQAFSSSLTYSSGSIFEWDLDVSGAAETHDKITAASLAGSGAQFKILLGSGDSFADTFWNTNHSWTATDLFGASNATVNLSNIFSSSLTLANFTANPLEGSFSFTNNGGTGNQLTWTAVPEPTSALAGILLGAGLLRRKRSA